MIGVFLYPISEQSFTLNAICELFKARTSDQKFFLKSKEVEKVKEDHDHEIYHVKHEISKHRYPKLKPFDKFKLWLSNRGLTLHVKCWSRKSKVKKLFEEGNNRL